MSRFRLAGVIGDPVGHSLSPVLHNHWLKENNIEGSYVKLNVHAERVAEVLAAMPHMGFVGANVTVPHKERVLALLKPSWLSDEAKAIGAVNTLTWQDGGWFGDNTDGKGFMENLRAFAKDLTAYLPRVAVLGAGGAARSIIYSLVKAGAKEVRILNRTREKAQALAKQFGPVCQSIVWEERASAMDRVTLLINTTTLGMNGHAPLELSLNNLPRHALVCDIVYNPLVTPLLVNAKSRGNPVLPGIGMLIEQARPGFKGWFGISPKVTAETMNLLEQQLRQG